MLGVAALVVWLVLLALSVVVLRRSSQGDSRGAHSASIALPVISVVAVVAVCVLAIAWPDLPVENPGPWNRA